MLEYIKSIENVVEKYFYDRIRLVFSWIIIIGMVTYHNTQILRYIKQKKQVHTILIWNEWTDV